MPRHHLWQAKDHSWHRTNSVSAVTRILRAGEQYLMKRSSRHLCEYKCATKRHPAWQLSQIQSSLCSRAPVNLTAGTWIISDLNSRAEGAPAFYCTWECVFSSSRAGWMWMIVCTGRRSHVYAYVCVCNVWTWWPSVHIILKCFLLQVRDVM